jgi:hypothetical protein
LIKVKGIVRDGKLVADVQGFARRQPTAFLGAAVLAGFAAVRFLKASTAGANASSSCCGLLAARLRVQARERRADTRAIQAYLGHRSIMSTVRYTALTPNRFEHFWKD